MTQLGRKQLLIGGEWRDAEGGRTMPVVNPATEEVIAEVAAASPGDVDAAVAAARAALSGPWGQMPARERGRLLWKIVECHASRVPPANFLWLDPRAAAR